MAMPDYVLIIVVSLVPIAALTLSLACGAARFADRAGIGGELAPELEEPGEDACRQ